ncbi:hypothetical protein Nepgr_012934 [Nepenthes gracilis]|uniref:Uncharacterized protein n=1 Tax=Nepenthes gracilis TaxID=150966 RepID=A0AAD3SGV4_NEPGR|nr:hypothetical protein Nepgr_012934 [Nepenthes gracilis]
MDDSSTKSESSLARIQLLEHERVEFCKDIEQLCMQQAGPSCLLVATRLHFQKAEHFYEIGHQTSVDIDGEDNGWDDKCACLLDSPADTGSFNGQSEDSTAQYIRALQEQWDTLSSSADILLNKLQLGLDIDNQLNRQVSNLARERIISAKLIQSGISRLHEYPSHQRFHILDQLNEGKSYLKSIIAVLQERFGTLNLCRDEIFLLFSDGEPAGNYCGDEKQITDPQEEEGHFPERNVYAARQQKLDELQLFDGNLNL